MSSFISSSVSSSVSCQVSRGVAKGLIQVLEEISLREFPIFLEKLGPKIFSETLPGSDPISFQSVKIKFSEILGDFVEIKIMRFSLSSREAVEKGVSPIIQITQKDALREGKRKLICPLSEREISSIFLMLSNLPTPAQVVWDDSALARDLYETEPKFWSGLRGYYPGVKAFYSRLHDLLLEEFKRQVVTKDLRNIVISDLGCGTGKLLGKLLKSLASKKSGLRDRVIKIVGFDTSRENIKKLKKVFLAARADHKLKWPPSLRQPTSKVKLQVGFKNTG
jgi:hypothetical protein